MATVTISNGPEGRADAQMLLRSAISRPVFLECRDRVLPQIVPALRAILEGQGITHLDEFELKTVTTPAVRLICLIDPVHPVHKYSICEDYGEPPIFVGIFPVRILPLHPQIHQIFVETLSPQSGELYSRGGGNANITQSGFEVYDESGHMGPGDNAMVSNLLSRLIYCSP